MAIEIGSLRSGKLRGATLNINTKTKKPLIVRLTESELRSEAQKNCRMVTVTEGDDEFEAMGKLVLKRFKPHCVGKNKKAGVNHKYVPVRIKLASHIIVSMMNKTAMCGFVLLQQQQNSLYVDLVCSNKGVGGLLMAEVEKLARSIGVPTTSLKALDRDGLVSWYYKIGYRHISVTDACRGLDGGKKKRHRRFGNPIDGFRMTKMIASPT
jgi:GNAT superfamily N-acetyltransferase